jgi:hypothetical protein
MQTPGFGLGTETRSRNRDYQTKGLGLSGTVRIKSRNVSYCFNRLAVWWAVQGLHL